jgi:hypothetical protein
VAPELLAKISPSRVDWKVVVEFTFRDDRIDYF